MILRRKADLLQGDSTMSIAAGMAMAQADLEKQEEEEAKEREVSLLILRSARFFKTWR